MFSLLAGNDEKTEEQVEVPSYHMNDTCDTFSYLSLRKRDSLLEKEVCQG